MYLIKTFLITLLVVLFLACGVAESVAFEPAVLVPPTAQAASFALSDPGSKEGRAQPFFDLPVLIWESYGETRIAVRPVWRGGGKELFCAIQKEEGTEISLDSEIEVIGEASCFYTIMKSEARPVGNKYFTGLLKIRIKSTGQEGWIWSTAIKYVK